jgi:hypothetical protein
MDKRFAIDRQGMGVLSYPHFNNQGGKMNILFVKETLNELSIFKSQYDLRKKKILRFLKDNINKVEDKSEVLLKLESYLQKKRQIKNDALLAFGVEEIIDKVYGGYNAKGEKGTIETKDN